jgi:hypothetical protein
MAASVRSTIPDFSRHVTLFILYAYIMLGSKQSSAYINTKKYIRNRVYKIYPQNEPYETGPSSSFNQSMLFVKLDF